MDSKSNGNKVWVTKLRHDIRIRELDEALSRHRLRAEEIRLLPRGRAVLIFDQQSGASSCLAKRDIFRDLGDKLGSGAFMMKYQPGYEDGAFRGQANLIQTQLSRDVVELFSRSRDALTSVTEQHKITWFYSTTRGLYLRGPAPAVKHAYDYLDNNVLGLLDTLSDDEDLFDRREDGHRDRNDSRHREDYGRNDNRRVEPPRPGTPEVEYAVVNKNRAKKTPTDLPENGSHRREDDNGYAEPPRRREDRSPDEPRGRAPETSLVNTPGHVKAYIRSLYRDDLMKMKSKYGVLFRDHPDGTIVEATDQCEPGSLGDACQELKAMCREVAGFVKETTIQLDKYGLRMDDVMSQLRDLEQDFPEVLFSQRHDNALDMVGDENDLFKAKTTLLDATQPGDRETRSRGKRNGHRRKDGDRDGDRGRKRRGDRDRSEDRHLDGDYDRDGDRGRKNRGDRDRSEDRHMDGDYDRDGDRGRKNREDRDRSEDRHMDGDYDRDGDRGRKNRGDRDRSEDRHLDGDYDRDGDRGRKNRGDRDRAEHRHLDEDEDRPRRENKDKQLNEEHDRPRKPHRDRPRETDRERHRKDRDRPQKHKTSNVAFEYVFRKAGLTLTVQQSHVLDQDTEAIVNPTDDRLEHVRGLSAAIAKEAGSRLRRESEDIVRRHGPLEVGDVTVTGGGHLSCSYVLHVFGPKSDKHGSRLRDACTSILKKCAKKGIASIAIPCVGSGGDTGNYARAMSDAIRHYVDHQTKKGELRMVNLVDTDPKVVDILAREMDESFKSDVSNGNDSPDGRKRKPKLPPKRTGPVVMQPEGTMQVKVKKSRFLPGYNRYCTILLTYEFPEGVQGEEHPRPGRPYENLNFVSYIPNSDEGKTVARLLKKAFDQKLLFTFEQAEGDTDKIVVKDCVRHKTKASGGVAQNGYPDPDYLSEVVNDLAAIGII